MGDIVKADDIAKNHSSSGGGALCQQLTQSVLDDYTDQLIAMVESSTHGLSIDDIRNFLTQYKSQSLLPDQSIYKTHFQRCLNRREQEVFDPNRRSPFKRVITMRFVDMFPPEGALDEHGPYISRRLLPGLFLAFEKMVGSDPFTVGHKACVAAMETVKTPEGIVIWEDLYAHSAAEEAVDSLLMRLVQHFDNPMKRIMWMLNIINNDLADPLDFDFEGEANREWRLDERGLINVLRHLFRHLRKRLKDKDEAHVLTQKYGQAVTRQLVSLITALDRAEV
ncbi:MAG TPA: hypothetical protein VIN57_03120 [Magnetovibrio sp.]